MAPANSTPPRCATSTCDGLGKRAEQAPAGVGHQPGAKAGQIARDGRPRGKRTQGQHRNQRGDWQRRDRGRHEAHQADLQQRRPQDHGTRVPAAERDAVDDRNAARRTVPSSMRADHARPGIASRRAAAARARPATSCSDDAPQDQTSPAPRNRGTRRPAARPREARRDGASPSARTSGGAQRAHRRQSPRRSLHASCGGAVLGIRSLTVIRPSLAHPSLDSSAR